MNRDAGRFSPHSLIPPQIYCQFTTPVTPVHAYELISVMFYFVSISPHYASLVYTNSGNDSLNVGGPAALTTNEFKFRKDPKMMGDQNLSPFLCAIKGRKEGRWGDGVVGVLVGS